jgi:adenylate cyclase
MAELEACYQNPDTRERKVWRHTFPPGREIILGRTGKNPQYPDLLASDWVMEDKLISAQHAILLWKEGKLLVKRRMKPTPTTNQIYHGSVPKDEFTIDPGDSFVIGNTLFTLHSGETQVPQQATPAGGQVPPPPTEFTLAKQDVHRAGLIDSDKRLDALRDLADQMKVAFSPDQLEDIVLDNLLKGMVYADTAAIVMISADTVDNTNLQVPVRRSKQRPNQADEFRPSRQLVYQAICKLRKGVLHVWGRGDMLLNNEISGPVTVMPRTDWAICVPLFERSSFGWAIYVTGRLPRNLETSNQIQQDHELRYYQQFTALVAEMFGATQQLADLDKELQSVRRFLPAKVLTAFDPQNIETLLQPRVADVTVLFCDIRGSCKFAEEGEEDLMAAWNQISEALQTMTEKIDANGGVIADLQGDAAMGFWGWPFAEDDQIEQAIRAALEINKQFMRLQQRGSGSFECGIGLAHGKAVAGRLGTFEQFKVDVYGPTVNLAARLESLTKQFGVRILVDETIADYLRTRRKIPSVCRTRKLCRIYPAGMSKAVTVSEILQPESSPGPNMRENVRLQWEQAVDLFLNKNWERAKTTLTMFANQPEHNKASTMILDFIQQHGGRPVEGWDGVIRMEKK